MKALLIALVATSLALPALAATYKIPEDDPIVTVVIPDKGWEATNIARGIEVSDEDDEVYLAIEGIDVDNIEAVVKAAVDYLDRQGVSIDASTSKESEGTLNGFHVNDLGWKGKDQDGDVVVHLTIVSVAKERGVLFTYWASPDGDKKHDATITAMVKSLKKVGN